jgi:hypothetical protein
MLRRLSRREKHVTNLVAIGIRPTDGASSERVSLPPIRSAVIALSGSLDPCRRRKSITSTGTEATPSSSGQRRTYSRSAHRVMRERPRLSAAMLSHDCLKRGEGGSSLWREQAFNHQGIFLRVRSKYQLYGERYLYK